MNIKVLCVISCILMYLNTFAQRGVSINSSGNNADTTSILDISSPNKGILIPRLNLTGTSSALPLTNPTTSLLVYNQATAGDVTPGYYYWSGSAWTRLSTGSGSSGWQTNGNTLTGTLPASPNEFIGTANNADMIFKTNNTERVRISSSGNIGVGNTNPSYKITLNGTGQSNGIMLGADQAVPSGIYHVSGGNVKTDQNFYSASSVIADQSISAGNQLFVTSSNNPQFMVRADASNKLNVTASSTGLITFDAAGTSPKFTFSDYVGFGTANPGSELDIKGTLRLSGATSGYVGLAVPAVAGSTTFTLPSSDGSNGQILTTNGSGTLSWADAGGGSGLGPMDGWWTIVTDFTNGWVTADQTGNSGSSRQWASLEAQSGNISGGKIRLQNSNFSNVANMGALWCDWTKVYDIEWVAQMVQNTANGKAWFMMTSSTTAGNDPTTGAIGFRVDGTALKGLVYGGGTLTITDLSETLVDTPKRLRVLYTPSTSVEFYVNGVLKATQTINLPSGGEEKMIVSTTNGADAAQNRPAVSRIYWYRSW